MIEIFVCLSFTSVVLLRNYSIDKGYHKKAKLINAFFLSLILVNYAYVLPSFIEYLLYLLGRGELPQFLQEAGMARFSNIVNFNTLVTLFVIPTLILMLLRIDKARKFYIFLLPIVFIGEAIYACLEFNIYSRIVDMQMKLVFFIFLIVWFLLHLAIILVYLSGFMRRFYQYDNSLQQGKLEKMEDRINKIGEDNE